MPEDPSGEHKQESAGTPGEASGSVDWSAPGETAGAAGADSDPNSLDEFGEPVQAGEDPRPAAASETTIDSPAPLVKASSGGAVAPPPAPPEEDEDEEDDGEEDGMLRMSFLDHLEELRMRIISCLYGIGVAFVVSLIFTNSLWDVVRQPAAKALTTLGFDPSLVITSPMEAFMIVWVKLPVLTAIFLASPWVLFQVWSFVAPGLYKRERRWAGPFILSSAGLFILGGLFAYFVAFRFGLTFLLGIGKDIGIKPMVSITEYFNLFVNVTLGIALVFELPVLIFFLTLLRIVSPGFLLRHSRYAILIIVIAAAIITPTPDAINLAIFVAPMCLLYFVGVFASYLLVMNREGRRFPWKRMILSLLFLVALVAGAIYLAFMRFGLHFQSSWPFLVR